MLLKEIIGEPQPKVLEGSLRTELNSEKPGAEPVFCCKCFYRIMHSL